MTLKGGFEVNTLHDRLDDIWDTALLKNLCKCGNDNNWSQNIGGSIYCEKCNEDVTKFEEDLQ